MTIDRNEIVQLQSRNAYLSFSDVQRGKKGDFFYIVGSDITLSQHDLTDASMNYIVQADTVHLTGDLRLPGHDLTINARLIRAEKAIQIDTSGTKVDAALDYQSNNRAVFGESATEKGKSGKPGEDGKNGGHGMRGGHIVFATEAFELASDLVLIADGSNGGQGQTGGDGGSAADGYDGVVGSIGARSNEWATEGEDAGNGGNGGAAGAGGNGGDAGHIFVGYVISRDESKISLHNTNGLAGASGEPGSGKPGGKGGKGGREIVPYSPKNKGFLSFLFSDPAVPGSQWEFSGERLKNGKNGVDGINGSLPTAAIAGASGEQQLVQIDYSFFHGDIASRPEWASSRLWQEARVEYSLCASYEQQSIALHRAGLIYMGASGDAEALSETATLLQWLVRTLPDEAFFNQLRNLSMNRLHQDLLDSSIQWLSLRSKASVLVWQLSQSLDYFGNAWNWVPLMSFTKYQAMASDLITAAAQAESLYQEYLSVQQNQSKMQEVLNQSLNGAKDRKNKLETNRLADLKTKNTMEDSIHTMEDTIRKHEASLEKSATEFVEALRKALGMESLKEVFNMVVTGVALVTSVGPAVAAFQANGAIRSALVSVVESGKPIVIDEKGKDEFQIDKEKKKKEADLSKAISNVKTVATAPYQLYKSGSNLLDLSKQIDGANESFGYRSTISMTRTQFEELLKPVYQKMPQQKVEAYRKAFYDYLDTVESYQQKLQQYRALSLGEDKNLADQLQIEAETVRIQQLMGQEIDFSLPSFHTYILNMYTESKQHVVKFLYEEYRAFRYMTLINEPFRSIRDNRVAELSKIHADITRKITEAINDSENLWQSFQGTTFILTEERFPEQFAALRKQEVAVFPLLLDNDALRDKIAGKAQMMVSNCQVYISGAKTSSEAIHVEYEQSGYSTFLDPYGKRFDFIHRASHGYYEYEKNSELHAIRSGATQSSGGELQLGENDGRIMPGLLSVWSFQLPKEDIRGEALNTNLDLSETNQIVVIFKGRAKSYMRSTNNRIPDHLKLPNKELPVTNDDELYTIPASIVESATPSKITRNSSATTDHEQSINNIVIEW